MSENTDFTGDGAFSGGPTKEDVKGALDKMKGGLNSLQDFVQKEQLKVLVELTELLGVTNDVVIEKMVTAQQLTVAAIEKLVEHQKGTLSEDVLAELLLNVRMVATQALDVQQTTSARMLKIADGATRHITQFIKDKS